MKYYCRNNNKMQIFNWKKINKKITKYVGYGLEFLWFNRNGTYVITVRMYVYKKSINHRHK